MSRRRSAERRLLGYLRPYAGLFCLSMVLMVVAAAFDTFSLVLLIPFLRSLFGADTVLPRGELNGAERAIEWLVGDFIAAGSSLDSLRNICLVVLGAIIVKNIALSGSKLLGVMIQERIERDMRDQTYAHMQSLPLGYFSGARTGQMITRVLNDTRTSRMAVSYALSDALRHVVTIIAYVVTMFVLSWRLALIALVLAPVLAALLGPLLRRLRRGYRRAYDEQGELLSVLQETVSGIRLVKAFGAEKYERGRFGRTSSRYTRGMIKTGGLAQFASPLSEICSALVALSLLWIGSNMVLSAGTMDPPQFLAFVMLALRLVTPVKALANFPPRVQSSVAAADRVFEILDAAAEPANDGGVPAVPPRETLRFEDVWFSYTPDRPVLRGIDLEVRRGEVVALVGPSGAGKSTMVDLLPRFIAPDRGRILMDGVDLERLSLASLRAQFGIVSQETVIFHDSVRANIAYGEDGRWSESEIEEAARAAHAHEFVRELSDGYDTQLGERGVRLSGGQRQRIGIARALLRDPPILILDEATSALDTESERLIQDAFARLLAGRTVFVIAHRLSTIQGADRIVVLEDGRLVESGTHEELLRAHAGLYRRLYELQFQRVAGELV